jgi:transcription elongation factor GreB
LVRLPGSWVYGCISNPKTDGGQISPGAREKNFIGAARRFLAMAASGTEIQSMSKAFTKETDGDEDEGAEDSAPALPVGTKNYMTAAGFDALRREFRDLLHVERPKIVEVVSWAAGNGDRSENGDYLYGKKKLREIDRRVRFLSKRLEIAEVVDPKARTNFDQIFFGATVTYAREDDSEHTITIVGVDEADVDKAQVSWISPIARALLKARVGDAVEIRTPAGRETIEVLDIRYEDA